MKKLFYNVIPFVVALSFSACASRPKKSTTSTCIKPTGSTPLLSDSTTPNIDYSKEIEVTEHRIQVDPDFKYERPSRRFIPINEVNKRFMF